MNIRLASSLCLALSAASIASGPAYAQLSSNAAVYASGLESPRGLKFGPDGDLYVAEAGTGGTVSTVRLLRPGSGPHRPLPRAVAPDESRNWTSPATAPQSRPDSLLPWPLKATCKALPTSPFTTERSTLSPAEEAAPTATPRPLTSLPRVDIKSGSWNSHC